MKLGLLYQNSSIEGKKIFDSTHLPENGILWIPMSNAKKILIQECAALKIRCYRQKKWDKTIRKCSCPIGVADGARTHDPRHHKPIL